MSTTLWLLALEATWKQFLMNNHAIEFLKDWTCFSPNVSLFVQHKENKSHFFEDRVSILDFYFKCHIGKSYYLAPIPWRHS